MIEKVLNNDAFVELLENDNVHAIYPVPIPIKMTEYHDQTEMTILWMHIQKQLRHQCAHSVYIFATTGLWKPGTKMPILAFLDGNDALNTKQWLPDFVQDFLNWDEESRRELFLPKGNFDRLVESGNPFNIAATITYPFPKFDFDGSVITSQVMDVWNWIQDNCRGRIWRWNQEFRFENGDDATLFKLVWK
jgi:hypothetical protein